MRAILPWLGATALVLAAGCPAHAQSHSGPRTVAFSDASRPGTLNVQLVQGSIAVRGVDRKDVLIEAVPRGGTGRYRSRLSDASAADAGAAAPSPAFTAREEGNVISVGGINPGKPIDFDIQVPSQTKLRLATVNVGDILVEAVEGELEGSNVNGSITLASLAR